MMTMQRAPSRCGSVADLGQLFGEGDALESVDPLGLLYLEPGSIGPIGMASESVRASPAKRMRAEALPGGSRFDSPAMAIDSEVRAVDQLHTISVLCSESADFLNALGDDE